MFQEARLMDVLHDSWIHGWFERSDDIRMVLAVVGPAPVNLLRFNVLTSTDNNSTEKEHLVLDEVKALLLSNVHAVSVALATLASQDGKRDSTIGRTAPLHLRDDHVVAVSICHGRMGPRGWYSCRNSNKNHNKIECSSPFRNGRFCAKFSTGPLVGFYRTGLCPKFPKK